MRVWKRRERVWAAATAAAVLVGLGSAWLLWPSAPGEQPRERRYRATTACLLTDDKGLAGEEAKAAWAGMQEASTATLIKVQHLSITGPQTAANGLSYFNALGAQKCAVVVAVGRAAVAAMAEGRAQFPDMRCVTVGGTTGTTAVTTVDAGSPAAIRSGVSAVVAAAA
jgi:hypothetical protein